MRTPKYIYTLNYTILGENVPISCGNEKAKSSEFEAALAKSLWRLSRKKRGE